MVTYVLDSSALLRYLEDGTGSARVATIIASHVEGTSKAIVAAPHWGEVAGVVRKKHGRKRMELVLERLSAFGFEVVAAGAERSVRAALISLERKLPYVDAFGVELAADSQEHILVTADFDFKSADAEVKIEFLPTK